MTTSHAVDLWLGELERHGHSPKTIDTYRRLLNKLADLDPRGDVDEHTATGVRRFLDDQAKLKRGGGRKAAATIAQNVSIVNGMFDWLTREQIIPRNPCRRNGDRILARPKQVAAHENDNIVSVSGADVRRLLEVANRSPWPERLAVNALIYAGARRHAMAVARIGDYDRDERTLTLREKGGKTIAKPLPHRLADLIDTAINAGVYTEALELGRGDYLIPGRAQQRRQGDRNDRVVWRLVRDVALEAGVTTHVHALRAAFAVQYLETNPGGLVALQALMGHKRSETTLVYLRRLDRRQAMETVRDMDWGDGQGEIRTPVAGFPTKRLSRAPLSATQPPVQIDAISVESFESLLSLTTVDPQPSFDAMTLLPTSGIERVGVAPRKE